MSTDELLSEILAELRRIRVAIEFSGGTTSATTESDRAILSRHGA
jgi:hypothetical protein